MGLQLSSPIDNQDLCDDYQRLAQDKVRGFKNSLTLNRYAEYPRLSWRFGHQKYDASNLPVKWLRSTFGLNVTAEQMHSQTVVTFSFAFYFIFFLLFVGFWWEGWEDATTDNVHEYLQGFVQLILLVLLGRESLTCTCPRFTLIHLQVSPDPIPSTCSGRETAQI